MKPDTPSRHWLVTSNPHSFSGIVVAAESAEAAVGRFKREFGQEAVGTPVEVFWSEHLRKWLSVPERKELP